MMTKLLDLLSDPTAGWTRRPPATDAAIESLASLCDFALPAEYREFLRYSNGGEGFLSIEPWYFQLCSAEEVIGYNQGYNVEEFLPGWFVIGSNGGGEMLAIRKRDGSPCPIFMVPFLAMSEIDAVRIADDFEMFAMALGRDRDQE